jgi:hypothetical protein
MPAEEMGPAATTTGPPAEPAPVVPPSPAEAELTGLGMIVAILRHMTTPERLELADYVSERYQGRVDVEATQAPPDYAPTDTNELTNEILRARFRGIEFGSLALAKILLDAGWRKRGNQ